MTFENGYVTKTTFWDDFKIADWFGPKAVLDTYKRAFNEWNNNVEYVTELTMVLNLRCWYWFEHGNDSLSKLYADLFYMARDWGYENLKGDDLTYFWSTLD